VSAEEVKILPALSLWTARAHMGSVPDQDRAILIGVHTPLRQPDGRKEALGEIQSANQGPTSGLEDNRSNFWKMVDRTKPGKLGVFSESELRDCQDYFAKLQSDSSVPLNEITIASERLTLIRSEIDGRHGDARHRRTQRLACWAIGLATIALTVAIGFGVAQFLAHRPIRENQPANIGTSPITPPTPMETPTVAQESTVTQEQTVAQEPTTTPVSPTPEPTVFAPVYAGTAPTSTPTATAEPTSKPKATAKPRKKPASRRRTKRKAEPRIRVEEFFRSFLQPKPAKSPSAVRPP
jgi:hypothetical protein